MLSVVVPCYNEESVIHECHARLTGVLQAMGTPYEIVFVNDGSRDATYAALAAIQAGDPRVVVVDLSRNFGHQLAVSAGLEVSQGDAVVIIDSDLQDPPEVIPEMVQLWQQNYQVVYGVRRMRRGESWFKLWTAKMFYRIINAMSHVKIPLETGDFRLIDRQVVNVMLRMPERHRLLRAMYSWVGFRQVGLPYERAPRFAGTTKYPLRKMITLALDGIISFSITPLRMMTIFGMAAAALAFAGVIYTFFIRIFTHSWVPGWATLFIGMLFMSGLQLICLGMIGEYIGRIYTEVKQRPLYIISAVLSSPSRQHSLPVEDGYTVHSSTRNG